MSPMERLVRVAEVSDPSAARVYAALLESAGIHTQLHGESLGPYVMATGDWALTEVWVPESAWDDAVEVLTGGDTPSDLRVLDRQDAGATTSLPRWMPAVAIGGSVVIAAAWLLARL